MSKVEHKIKQLNEAISVCEKIENQVSWATDFADFRSISYALDPILEIVDECRTNLEEQLDQLEEEISSYEYKKFVFEKENEILVED